jgi:TRAP-type C4-dicarboxylate transport system substrate-binding protein
MFKGGFSMKLKASAALAAAMMFAAAAANAQTELRLSHQWSTGDVRHQVAQMIADEVAAADVGLEITIYPSESLFRAREQYNPLSRGQVDMIVYPLSYSGGQRPEYNLTLMPGLVRNHDHAARLNESPFMERIEALMAEDDVMVLVHGYLAGGFASTGDCITRPEHVNGLTTRAAGRAFEEMLAAAGASISSMASSEIYNAMQTGVLQAVNTSSSSFASFRLQEQVACYTPAGDYALWFMYQPVLMNLSTFEGLTEEQQAALTAAAANAEAWYLEQAKAEDAASVAVFREAGVQIAEMTEDDFNAWLALAQESSYPSFVATVPNGQELLDLALSVE